MNNLLTSNYLFMHDHCTSIKFEFIHDPDPDIEYPTRELDYNNRLMIIKFIESTKYSDLSKFNSKRDMFLFLSDELIEEDEALTCKTDIILNGIQYWFCPRIEFFTIHIFNGKRVTLPNTIFCSNKSLIIYLNSEIISTWKSSEWIEFVNKSPFIKCRMINERDFKLVSFRTVDLKIHPRNILYTKVYEDSTDSIYIDAPDIIAGFIRYLRSQFPDFTISREISDLHNQKQKKKLLFYNPRLPELGETACAPYQDPVYGMMRQINIGISWEFLSDDFDEMLGFRSQALLNTGLFRHCKYDITDIAGNNWSYGVEWNTEVANEIDRSPQTPLLEETALFSIKFECTIDGWIVEKYDQEMLNKSILYPITRFYVDDWKYIGALFDRSDPNVYTSFILTLGPNYYLKIKGDREYPEDWTMCKLYFTGPDDQLLLQQDVTPMSHFWNYHDETHITLNLDVPINPSDLKHGEVYYGDSRNFNVGKDALELGSYIIRNPGSIELKLRDFLMYEQSRLKDLGNNKVRRNLQ